MGCTMGHNVATQCNTNQKMLVIVAKSKTEFYLNQLLQEGEISILHGAIALQFF